MIRSADKLRPKENCANRESLLRLGFNLLAPFSFTSYSFFSVWKAQPFWVFTFTCLNVNCFERFGFFSAVRWFFTCAQHESHSLHLSSFSSIYLVRNHPWPDPELGARLLLALSALWNKCLYSYLNAVLPLSWHGCNSPIILRLWLRP